MPARSLGVVARRCGGAVIRDVRPSCTVVGTPDMHGRRPEGLGAGWFHVPARIAVATGSVAGRISTFERAGGHGGTVGNGESEREREASGEGSDRGVHPWRAVNRSVGTSPAGR